MVLEGQSREGLPYLFPGLMPPHVPQGNSYKAINTASPLAQPPTVSQVLATAPGCLDMVTIQPLAGGDGSGYPQAHDLPALLLICCVTPDKPFTSLNLCPHLENG